MAYLISLPTESLVELNKTVVKNIKRFGGSFLGSSRFYRPERFASEIVRNLEKYACAQFQKGKTNLMSILKHFYLNDELADSHTRSEKDTSAAINIYFIFQFISKKIKGKYFHAFNCQSIIEIGPQIIAMKGGEQVWPSTLRSGVDVLFVVGGEQGPTCHWAPSNYKMRGDGRCLLGAIGRHRS